MLFRVVLAVLFVSLISVHPTRAERVERRVGAMGTTLSIAIDASSREAGLAASEAAVRAVESVEQNLSTWRDDSELTLFNAAPVSRAITISTELLHHLENARQCQLSTSGYFDPSMGALVQAWGLRGSGRLPSENELKRARELMDFSSITFSEEAGKLPTAIKSKAGVLLEEGAFGKGAGLDAALMALAAAPAVTGAVLDFGGHVSMLPQTAPVAVAIADPDDRRQPVLSVLMHEGSLSVSGNSEKAKVVAGVRIGHILNPKTGRAADDFGAVVVWSTQGVFADCLSTALFAMGAKRAIEWANQHPEHRVLVMTRGEHGRIDVMASEGWRGRIQPLEPRVRVRFQKSAGAGLP